MIKVICDICGKEIPKYTKSKVAKKYIFSVSVCGTQLDMCEDCRKALHIWVINRKAECKTSATDEMIERIAKA